ncbi:MAG: PIN domain-containing protein, partial [Verrucomicrobia bacterium]|nr:PIN domain-containing protein [Verrucomicrobiota bacterium]
NAFVDSNVLVYAAEEKTPLARKTTIARELLLQPGLHFSVQVLSEFVVNARHPHKLNLPREREQRWLQGWLLRPVASITTATFLRALAIHVRYRISHWDSLILAAATEMNCSVVYSEDLKHGQEFDSVKVINPFL